MIALPATASAGSNCKSIWNKATGKIEKVAGPVAKLVCAGIAVETPATARQCLDLVEKTSKEVDKIVKSWNEDGDSWNIGPRPLPHDRYQTGAVSTERQFVGQPVLGDTYSLTIERTGGKAKKGLVVKVCMVDENGYDVKYKSFTLSKDGPRKKTVTFRGVAGTYPLIHLNNQRWGTNAHKYTIKGGESGEAPNVAKAREILAATRSVTTKTRK
ncbi:MAG: hypothetical protein D6705_15445 [Deltaproteobacteria bacterium]|nr:MAG: hypothetical protein D6705_15445 [Deltaproteobacteria bacterium]